MYNLINFYVKSGHIQRPGGKMKLRVGAQRQKAKKSRSYVKKLKENIW